MSDMHVCNERGCDNDGWPVNDYYGIFAGYWCDAHESNAPGQGRAYFDPAYAGESLEEYE